MTPQPQERYGANRRRDFRCPIPEPGQEATLRKGKAAIPVWVLDESAGGFAVRAKQPIDLQVDDHAEFSTPAGVFEVRVAHLAVESPPPRSEQSPDKQTNSEADASPSYRVGLQRVRDVGFWVQQPNHTPWYKLVGHLRVPLPVNWDAPTMVAGIILAICVVVPLVIFAWYGEEGTRQPMRESRPAKTPSRVVELIAPSSPRADHTGRRAAASTRSGANHSGAHNGIAGMIDRQKLARTIRELAGATPFELPDVVRMLSLSEDQQAAISEIVASCGRLLQELDVLDPGMSRQEHTERRTALLDEARRRAEKILNPHQQAQWRALEKAQNGKGKK